MPILARKDLSEALRAGLATATGRPVGLMAAPKPPAGADTPSLPYAVLYPISGGGFSGPVLAAPDEDVDAVYQVTSVGGSLPGQADWMGDRVRRAILERDPQGDLVTAFAGPAGWKIDDRWPDGDLPGLEEETQGLHQVVERFVFRVTPA